MLGNMPEIHGECIAVSTIHHTNLWKQRKIFSTKMHASMLQPSMHGLMHHFPTHPHDAAAIATPMLQHSCRDMCAILIHEVITPSWFCLEFLSLTCIRLCLEPVRSLFRVFNPAFLAGMSGRFTVITGFLSLCSHGLGTVS